MIISVGLEIIPVMVISVNLYLDIWVILGGINSHSVEWERDGFMMKSVLFAGAAVLIFSLVAFGERRRLQTE